jgi:hypothetical protein
MNTSSIYVMATIEIKQLQIWETISNEKHVSVSEIISIGTSERG